MTPWEIQAFARERGLHVSVNVKLDDFVIKGAIRGAEIRFPTNTEKARAEELLGSWLDEIMPKRKGPKGEVLYRADAVFLGDLPEIDIDDLHLSVGRGKAAVLMAPPRNVDRGFHLSDEYAGAYRPDIGRVVAVHESCEELKRGDYVVCRPYSGFVYEEFHNGQRIQFFGRVLNEFQEFENTPWDDCIVMKWADGFVPVGRNMTVDRAKDDSPLLPKELQKWKDFGQVMEVGGSCDADFIGNRIWWKDAGPEELLHIEYGDHQTRWIVHGELVLMVELEEVVA